MSCSSLFRSFIHSLRRAECSAHLRPRRKSLIFGRLPLEVAQFRHSNRQSESANQQSWLHLHLATVAGPSFTIEFPHIANLWYLGHCFWLHTKPRLSRTMQEQQPIESPRKWCFWRKNSFWRCSTSLQESSHSCQWASYRHPWVSRSSRQSS